MTAAPPSSRIPPNRFPSSPSAESVGSTWVQDWLSHIVFAVLSGLAVLTLIFLPLGAASAEANNIVAVPNDFDTRLSDFFRAQGLRVETHSEWSLLKEFRFGSSFVVTNETMAHAAMKAQPDATFIPLYPKSVVLASKKPEVESITDTSSLSERQEIIYLDQGVSRLELMSALALDYNPDSQAQTFSTKRATQLLQHLRRQGRLKTGHSPQDLQAALNQGYLCLTTDRRSLIATVVPPSLHYAKFPTLTFNVGLLTSQKGELESPLSPAPPPPDFLNAAGYPSISSLFRESINAQPITELADFEQFTWYQSLSNDTYGGSWEWENTNESNQIAGFVALLGLLSFWAGWRFWTTTSPYVRRAVLIQAGVLSMWILARVIKHALPGIYERYAWYYYYVPIYATMTILFFVISHSCRSLPPRYRTLRAFVAAVGCFLTLLVFTNDLHHLVLRFGHGQSGVDYQYGPGYYAYYLAVLIVFAVIIYVALWGFKGNRLRLLFGLGVLFAFMLAYSLAYTLRVPFIRATENVQIYCLYFLFAWEILFFIGLIPQNRGYTRFFTKSKLPIEIVDRDWAPRFVTSTPLQLDESVRQRLQASSDPVLVFDDSASLTRTLYCQTRRLAAGHVIWETDVTAVHELEKTLAAIREREAHQTRVLSAEYEALLSMEESAQAPLLYDRLDELMNGAIGRVRSNAGSLSAHLDKKELAKLLRSIKMDLGYAKRAGLLTLRHFEDKKISVNALTTLLSQSCTDFSYANALAGISGPTTGAIQSDVALRCLEGLHRGLGCVVGLSDLAVFINFRVAAAGRRAQFNWILDICADQAALLEPLLGWPGAQTKMNLDDGAVNLCMTFKTNGDKSLKLAANGEKSR